MIKEDRYFSVLKIICSYYGLDEKDIFSLLKQRENKYLLLLLMKKCRCMDDKRVMDLFNVKSKRTISNNIKKAEEKFFINKLFRDKYFEIEENLLK